MVRVSSRTETYRCDDLHCRVTEVIDYRPELDDGIPPKDWTSVSVKRYGKQSMQPWKYYCPEHQIVVQIERKLGKEKWRTPV